MNNLYNNKSNIITNKHINNILSLVNNNKPNIKINLPQNKILIKEYNKLYIKDNNSNNNNYKLELKNNIKINNITFVLKEKEDSDGNNICRLNSKDINFPLYFRNRKNGDYIILKNSNVKKKIKEIMIENKLPISQIITYPILIDSNNNIIWIPGIKKSKFCSKKNEKYDIIIECKEREENYE